MSARQLRDDWKRFLESGGYSTPPGRAACALASARTLAQWREVGGGKVRLVAEPERENYFDVYGDPDGYTDGSGKRVTAEEERKRIIEQIEQLGCYFVAAEYLTPSGEWEHADSIGMITGCSNPASPFENCYVPGLMRSALDKLAQAWQEAGEAI